SILIHFDSGSALRLAVDRFNTDTIYVLYAIYDDAIGTLFRMVKSADGGASWGGLPISIADPTALAIDPGNPNTLYVSTFANVINARGGFTIPGVYKSTDGGLNWQLLNADLNHADLLAVDPANSQIIYALHSSVYKSTDGGRNFTVADSGLPHPLNVYTLAIG